MIQSQAWIRWTFHSSPTLQSDKSHNTMLRQLACAVQAPESFAVIVRRQAPCSIQVYKGRKARKVLG